MHSERWRRARWRIPRFLLPCLLAVVGCAGLRLRDPLRIGAEDWTMAGKDAARTHATIEAVLPPLTLEWEADLTGGIGNGSPLLVDTVVFVGTLRGELHAFSVHTGKRLGYISVGDAISGAPVLDGNVVFVAASNTRESLIAFDLLEGKPRWKREYGDLEVSPLLYDQKLFFGTTGGMFFCVERDRGDEVWKFEIPGNTKRKGIRSTAAAFRKTIVFGADDGIVYALNAETGRPEWQYPTGASIFAAPAIGDGRVYVGNAAGVLYALDVTTGKLVWQCSLGGSLYASSAIRDSLLVIGSTTGVLYCLHAYDGSTAWVTNLSGVINSSAAIAGDLAYVGTLRKELAVVRLTDGKVVAKQAVQGRIKTSPAVAKGRVVIASDDRMVLSFKGEVK